jgi:hypothetical protein
MVVDLLSISNAFLQPVQIYKFLWQRFESLSHDFRDPLTSKCGLQPQASQDDTVLRGFSTGNTGDSLPSQI